MGFSTIVWSLVKGDRSCPVFILIWGSQFVGLEALGGQNSEAGTDSCLSSFLLLSLVAVC